VATLTFADLKPREKPAAAPPSPKSPPQAKSPADVFKRYASRA
jgi:hypothetical protein